jgi:hypothetical protein
VRRLSLLILVACKATQPEPATTPPSAEPQPTTAPVKSTCSELASKDLAQQAFDDGRRQLDASRSGDHFIPETFEPAIARLREAANANHGPAQALLGRTLFGTMFTNDAPQPSERDAYIEAIAFLRTAAIAGDPEAAAFMPGLTLASPPLAEPPLADIPAEWVTEAWRRADAWLACHGPPWR